MIDISVIIVNWNTKALLIDCVESLYSTTRESAIEIIVVDNASTDGSVEALLNRFPQVQTIVNSKNLGFAKANNIGIEKALGHYICLVNSDVKALDGVIDNMRAYMDQHPNVGALAPKTFGADMLIQKNCREFPNLRNIFCQEFYLSKMFPNASAFRSRDMIQFDYDTVMEIEVLSGCFLMVRRSLIAKVGPLDERFFFYSEDVDWCKRIHDAGWKLVYFPKAQAIHYGHSSTSSAPVKFQVQIIKANWQYWKKHKNLIECGLFWLIKLLGTMARGTVWQIMAIVSPSRRPMAKISAAADWKIIAWLMNPRI